MLILIYKNTFNYNVTKIVQTTQASPLIWNLCPNYLTYLITSFLKDAYLKLIQFKYS